MGLQVEGQCRVCTRIAARPRVESTSTTRPWTRRDPSKKTSTAGAPPTAADDVMTMPSASARKPVARLRPRTTVKTEVRSLFAALSSPGVAGRPATGATVVELEVATGVPGPPARDAAAESGPRPAPEVESGAAVVTFAPLSAA